MNIENLDIERIVPYQNNARYNDQTVAVLKESIQKYGFNQPLAVVEKGENYEIVVGHARYKALKEMGVTAVPCLILHLPEDKIKQYRIADNASAEFSTWDETKLIRELQSMDTPMELDKYFASGIGSLMGDYATSTNKSPHIEEAQTQRSSNISESQEMEETGQITQSHSETMTELVQENQLSEKEEKPQVSLEKKSEEYRQMMSNIEQEREVKNRQYREIVCPNCGRKYTLSCRN